MKKGTAMHVIFWFVVIGTISVIFTPAFESQGNLFDRIDTAAACLTWPVNIGVSGATLKAFGILSLICVAGDMVYQSDKAQRRDGEEYGSSRWGGAGALCKKYADRDFSKNRLFTQNLRISETGKKIALNLITLVIGGSGAGKSFFYCIPNLLQAQGSYIVLDPSGELLARTGGFLKMQGYQVRALNLDDMPCSFGYNPFAYIKTDDDVLRLVKNLFKATVPKGSHSNDPMWDNQAEALCMAYMLLICHEGSGEEKSMRTLMYLAREDAAEEDEDGNIKETAVSALFHKVELEDPDHIAVRFYKTARKGSAKTVLGVQTTLMGRLAKFNLESVMRLMDFDEMGFEKIGTEKTALFLVIPAEDTSFNFIISMAYAQLMPALYKMAKGNPGLKLEVPVHFMMDEFSNVPLPDDFLTILTTARKHAISFSIIIQAISQLKGLFEKEQFNTLIGNADELLYLGSGEFDTQKYISERIGKETIIVKSHTLGKGIHGSYSENSQPAARALLEPSEVDTRLSEKQALVKLRGNAWVMDEKINPKGHPNYRHTSDVTGAPFSFTDGNYISSTFSFHKEEREGDINIYADDISDDIYERIEIISGEG